MKARRATASDAVTQSDTSPYISLYAHAHTRISKQRENASLCVTASLRAPTDSTVIDRLADAVRRLSPHHRDPERFHVDKHEIAAELEQLASAMRRAAR